MTRGILDLFNAAARALSYTVTHLCRPGWSRLAVIAAIGLFGGAAALGMVRPPNDKLPLATQVETRLNLAAADVAVATVPAAPYINETRIRRGDTLAAVLQRLALDEPALQKFLTHDASARSIYKLYPGRSVQAATDATGALLWLRYIHTAGYETDGEVLTKLLEVRPQGEGFVATELSEPTDRQLRIAVGTIQSSLFGATDAAAIPDAITLQMADVLGTKVDFLRDLRQGDQFRVVYETHSHQGRYAGAGRLLAIEFINDGETHSAVWFTAEGRGAYYDFDGNNLRGAFLKTALKFSRISSTFGMRQHPIHGRWMGHKGVDYAAPTGTPIHSTADGVIEFAGTQSGYGNVVIIRHSDKYSTLYAHQSRIGEGMRKGTRVAQGQLIGHVGSTGWATGPHLHYEFRINNQPVDPLSVDLPVARPLGPSEARKFAKTVAPYKQQLAMITQFQTALSDSMTNVAVR